MLRGGHRGRPHLRTAPGPGQPLPRYAEVALGAGIRAQLGLRLFDPEESHAAINLHSTRAGAFSDADAIAALFAHSSTPTIQYARELSQAESSLEVRRTLGAAVGIAMERCGLK